MSERSYWGVVVVLCLLAIIAGPLILLAWWSA
jgi:hypothetical protein